jgi:hypothetical protein
MVKALSESTKKQRTEMAKRIYMRHKKDIKVHGFVQLIRSVVVIRLDITGKARRFVCVHNRSGW